MRFKLENSVLAIVYAFKIIYIGNKLKSKVKCSLKLLIFSANLVIIKQKHKTFNTECS
jgi:hypothetical protein